MSGSRRAVSLSDKLNILEKYDRLPKMGQREAAGKLNVSQSVLSRILRNRKEIELEALQNECQSRKRKRDGKDADVEHALKEWFLKVREKDARVSGTLLREKAEELAEKMGKDNFKATEGWFHRWKKRENISYQKTHGEQGDADREGARTWLEREWPSLIAEFQPSDVFNADETGLYYRALPEHTYVLKNERAMGTKTCKERLTLMCCASMMGEKKKLLVIGKSKQPRCFKRVTALPVDYAANKNAWMTQEIFSGWLAKWDKELDRKILLLVDNCTAHNVNLNLKNIKLVFLPANTTSLIQPCDQGIIRTFKAYYRTKMRRNLITLIDETLESQAASTSPTLRANELAKKINILEALHLANEAWDNVSDVTIRNCFRHGGFVKIKEDQEEDASCPKEPPEDLTVRSYEDWMDIDNHLQTTEAYTEANICEFIMNKASTSQNEGTSGARSNVDDEEADEDEVPPSHAEILRALGVLRNAVKHYGTSFEKHYDYEKYVAEMMENAKKQTKITNFFKPS